MPFNLRDFELGRVAADTPAVAEMEKRHPEAPWLRFGPIIVFYRRPKGVVLKQVMNALHDLIDEAWASTSAYVAAINGLEPPPLAQQLHFRDATLTAYRAPDGRLGAKPEFHIQNPLRGAPPIIVRGTFPETAR